ncbi:hypothetical protein OG810_05305 [Streptomyces sp. NBC_01693]|uniref:hypothetical protein n=1 Tax=Streptomyces sp. NBC_01693 TaxID=2975912 RepID=UPI002E31CEEF|nr:hypothetical protein [Streptomyces sp. NBC_01693]
MAWDEWQQIKANVAERHSTDMRLNELPPDAGPSSNSVTGGVKSSKKAWLTAGEGVGSLRTALGTALRQLEEGQAGLGTLESCLGATAQREVYSSWKRYLGHVSKRCGSLQSILEQVGHDQLKTDEAVKAEIDVLQVQFTDTDAVGGRAKGR